MNGPPIHSAAARPSAHAPWIAFLCLASSMALVGSYVGLSKMLVGVFPIFLLALLRFGIAAVAMAGWVRRGRGEPRLDGRARRLVFLESFFGNFLFSVCMLFGVSMTSATAAGVIMAGIPAAVALLSRLFLKERIAPRTLAGIACAVAGIALVSIAQSAEPTRAGSLVGNLLLIAAVLCEATYVVIGKQLTLDLSPRRISALINLWGLALVLPFGLWQAWGFDFGSIAPASWGLLVFYAVAASVVTVWLWMTGLRQVPASQAGIFTVMLPVSAAAVGVIFLGETISAAQAAGLGLALVGVVLTSWQPGAARLASTPAPGLTSIDP